MKSAAVIQDAVAEKGPKEVAAGLGVSLSLIYKWSEGKTGNPLDRVDELVKATGSTALLSWLCTQSGGSFLPRPPAAQVDENRLVAETQRMRKDVSAMFTGARLKRRHPAVAGNRHRQNADVVQGGKIATASGLPS